MRNVWIIFCALFLTSGCYRYIPLGEALQGLRTGQKYKVVTKNNKPRKLFFVQEKDSVYVFSEFRNFSKSDRSLEIDKSAVKVVEEREIALAETIIFSAAATVVTLYGIAGLIFLLTW